MFKSYCCIIVVAFLVEGALSQIIQNGPCPDVGSVNPLDVDRYMGKWSVSYRVPFALSDNLNCFSVVFNNSLGNDNVVLTIGGVSAINGASVSLQMASRVVNQGSLLITDENYPTLNGAVITVVSTNYVGYGIGYNCINLPDNRHAIISIILTREINPSKEDLDEAVAELEKNNIDFSYFEKVNQNGCN